MDWLTVDWIVTNWVPLTVALVLGWLLGWLLTGLPAGRRATEYEARATESEGRARKAERDLNDLRRESEPLRGRLANLQGELDQARARAADLEKERAALEEARDALRAELAAAALPEPDAGAESAADEEPGEALALAPGAESLEAEFTAVARASQGPSPHEVALSEAYNRLADLQRALEERDQILSSRAAEVEHVRGELQAAQASLRELETRHIRAREDVASELAVLASTMIKMKDDALVRADARIAALSAELEAARAVSEAAGSAPYPGARSMASAE
jgi:predicted nuclease with TOPRIM domain